jgi:hypothetical protein
MKLQALTLAALMSITATVFAAGDHKHDHVAKNGGIVVETKQGDLEIVAKPDVIQLFVDDHGKPTKLDGAKAKVTLLNGSEKTDVELAVAGDKLEAKGAYKVTKGTKGVAVLTLAGKPPVTARFTVK